MHSPIGGKCSGFESALETVPSRFFEKSICELRSRLAVIVI
jgi:hypothetical protein